ncbi:MAG: hypothetical protein CM15mP120_16600 [Pseudomonadota bacterium]|nr:MAG: hypothetical protein CM15mP120_16600 [Pseudomonadota bacterium]
MTADANPNVESRMDYGENTVAMVMSILPRVQSVACY